MIMSIRMGSFQKHCARQKSHVRTSLYHCKAKRPHILLRKRRTETSTATESREVVVLVSGAWKTYVISDPLYDEWLIRLQGGCHLLSYTYTNEMSFAPLQDFGQ
jgi:hypothetical protein